MNPGLAFLCILAGSVAFACTVMCVIHRRVEGAWPEWTDRRSPTPLVTLVAEMLESGIGWSLQDYSSTWRHSTGVRLGRKYDGTVRDLSIDGVEVPLRGPDKRRLTRAGKSLARQEAHVAEEAAAKALSAKVVAMAERIQAMETTVVPLRKRA